jgi:hypothetical protein
MLSEYPLEPKELFDIEMKTIGLIRSTRSFQEIGERLVWDADNAFAKMSARKNDKDFNSNIDNDLFNFDSWIESEDKKYKIFFGGLIRLLTRDSFDDLTYYFAMFDKTKEKLVRKFHFDFHNRKSDKSQKPFYHIQYAGRLSPYLRNELNIDLKKAKEIEEDLESKLDFPRIPYMPMSFIQLITLIVKEFLPYKAPAILDDNCWYGHLRESEKKLCEKFHCRCLQTIRNNKSLSKHCFY